MRAVAEFDPELTVLTAASPAIEAAAAASGLRAAVCFLADRAYGDDGQLVPRKLPGSVIKDPDAVMARVTRLLTDGTVTTQSGGTLAMPAASILLHGDTPGAVTLALAVRAAVEQCGGRVAPLSTYRPTHVAGWAT